MRTLYRSALGWFLLLGTGAILGGILHSSCRSRARPEPGVTTRPAAEVLASFRAALAGRDSDALEAAAVDICGRRLLAGMSRDEIVAALGDAYSLQWTPLDPKKDRDLLLRLFAKKADYLVYGFYDPDKAETTALGLAFDHDRLAWSQFGRGSYRETKCDIWTDYLNLPASVPSSRPATSDPSTQPDG